MEAMTMRESSSYAMTRVHISLQKVAIYLVSLCHVDPASQRLSSSRFDTLFYYLFFIVKPFIIYFLLYYVICWSTSLFPLLFFSIILIYLFIQLFIYLFIFLIYSLGFYPHISF